MKAKNLFTILVLLVVTLVTACSHGYKARRLLDAHREDLTSDVSVVEERMVRAKALRDLSAAMHHATQAMLSDPSYDNFRLFYESYFAYTLWDQNISPEFVEMMMNTSLAGLDNASSEQERQFFCYQTAKLLITAPKDVGTYRQVKSCLRGRFEGSLYNNEILELVDIQSTLDRMYAQEVTYD